MDRKDFPSGWPDLTSQPDDNHVTVTMTLSRRVPPDVRPPDDRTVRASVEFVDDEGRTLQSESAVLDLEGPGGDAAALSTVDRLLFVMGLERDPPTLDARFRPGDEVYAYDKGRLAPFSVVAVEGRRAVGEHHVTYTLKYNTRQFFGVVERDEVEVYASPEEFVSKTTADLDTDPE